MNKKELIKRLSENKFSKNIISAFKQVKREDFIPEAMINYAYEDTALSIGYGQTISQPYTIAFMLNLLELKAHQKILEVGSGSGYVLALINQISKNSEIIGIERVYELAKKSVRVLNKYKNIRVISGNALSLIEELGNFDRILASASAGKIPEQLINSLKINGILVIPVRNSIFQIKKTSKGLIKKEFYGFVFVPLVDEGRKG